MSSYFLPRHIFLCYSGGHIVLLDVHKHRYRAFQARGLQCLAASVAGWPAGAPGHELDRPMAGGHVDELAQSLVRQGVLTASPASGKDATPVYVPSPVGEILAEEASDAVSLRTFALFGRAFLSTMFMRRFRSFRSIVAAMRRRRQLLDERSPELDAQKTCRLLEAHVRLRPLFFASRQACFFESLLLLNFLAYHGIGANWIFGVRMKPWLAHCWLQHGNVILNDSAENIRLFTPIMMV